MEENESEDLPNFRLGIMIDNFQADGKVWVEDKRFLYTLRLVNRLWKVSK